jgi:hypothetical protein
LSTYLELLVTASLVLNALALYWIYKAMPVIVKLTNRRTSDALDMQASLLTSVFARLADLESEMDELRAEQASKPKRRRAA